MRPVVVTGLTMWTPGFASIEAWARGEADPSVTDCACAWVPARLLRGASRFTRMLGEAADRATRDAGADPKTIATVYGSDYGEIETMVVLLDTIFRGDGQLSPMRFKNSVHNAASGLASIGQGNQSFSTALAAGTRTFEASMLEAMALLDERAGAVVVSIADDVLPEPLLALEGWEALAVGIVLEREADPSKVLATLSDLAVEETNPTPRATRFRGRALGDRL
jgi:3-oxoacyl-(acyl-carrier-protein) synthase